MAFRLEYSEQAAQDLDEILNYISINLNSPIAAKNLYLEVQKKHVHLRENPFIYSLYHDEKLRKKGYRTVPVKNYIIFFTINENDSIVDIIRILYAKRDIPAQFDDN